MLDFILRRARISDDGRLSDIGFLDGRIAAIEPSLEAEALEEYDADGLFCCPGLIETHIHLDKSRIIERCAPATGRKAEAMRRVSDAKHTFSPEDVYSRARETLERCLISGTTRMRTHVEVDPKVGLSGFEGVQRLARDYAWGIDVELCVFPQEGLTNNPGTKELIIEALKRGADAIGAAPSFDTDPAAQIRWIFEQALEFDVDVDMHLDFGNSPKDMDIDLVCELTEKHGLGGRVAVGHATKLSTMPPEQQKVYARRLAEAGVALTVLPATDLFLMGRDQHYNVRRGVVDAQLFCAQGCTCSISTNNVLNPFTPFGDSSLVRMANLHANILQLDAIADIGRCFDLLTTQSAKLLNLGDYGIAVGNPADVVVIDAESKFEAVAEIAAPLAVFKHGRRTVSRPRPTIHYNSERMGAAEPSDPLQSKHA